MNRAVAAKLQNPDMSLYDALVIGGFNYPRNVDAATMDNDRVTLGQRKNQLNRRLRMARKSRQKKLQAKAGEELEADRKKETAGSGAAHLVIANSYLRQKRGKVAPKPKPEATSAIKEEPKQKKQRLQNSPTSVSVSPSGADQLAKKISLGDALTASLLNNLNDQHKVGDDVNVPSLSDSVLLDSSTVDNDWWQTSIVSPHDDPNTSVQQHLNMVVEDFDPICSKEEQNQTVGNTWNKRVVSNNSFATEAQPPQSNDVQSTIVLQEVAAKGESSSVSSSKEQIGLLFFQVGLRDLYRKSMMAAGYTEAEASEFSPTFQKFAFQAWKNECERLQLLLKNEPESH